MSVYRRVGVKYILFHEVDTRRRKMFQTKFCVAQIRPVTVLHVSCFIVIVLIRERKDGTEETEDVCLGGARVEGGIDESNSTKKL